MVTLFELGKLLDYITEQDNFSFYQDRGIVGSYIEKKIFELILPLVSSLKDYNIISKSIGKLVATDTFVLSIRFNVKYPNISDMEYEIEKYMGFKIIYNTIDEYNGEFVVTNDKIEELYDKTLEKFKRRLNLLPKPKKINIHDWEFYVNYIKKKIGDII